MSTEIAKLATMGDNCIDLYLDPINVSAVGGQALNVAVIWARSGWNTEYIGAVGRDVQGERITSTLTREGIVNDRVQVLVGRTATTTIEVLPNGDRVLLNEDQGACDYFSPTEDDLAHLASFKHVHAANLPNFRAIAKKLHTLGVPMSYDFSTRHETDDLEGIDIGFYSWPSSPESDELSALAAKAKGAGVRVVVVTCGEFGSAVFDDGKRYIAQAPTVQVVDTCGAGDTYAAIFMSERLRGAPIESAMGVATESASNACLHIGAWKQETESN